MAHFFVVISGSKIHERVAHFFIDIYISHGREIKAACGQLANTYNKAKKQQK